jgi:hypothetical protein
MGGEHQLYLGTTREDDALGFAAVAGGNGSRSRMVGWAARWFALVMISVVVMFLLPGGAEYRKIRGQCLLALREFTITEAEVLAQAYGAIGTSQVKERFVLRSNDVDICGLMVVGIDDHS